MVRRERGFTLIELMVTITVAAILAIVAVPAMSALMLRNAMTADINRLVASLHLARREAVTHAIHTVVCPGTPATGCRKDGDWGRGWLVFHDPGTSGSCKDSDGDLRCDSSGEAIVHVEGPLEADAASLNASGNLKYRAVYKPTGFADGYAGTFSMCPDDDESSVDGRGLTLSLNGRVRPSTPADLSCGGS